MKEIGYLTWAHKWASSNNSFFLFFFLGFSSSVADIIGWAWAWAWLGKREPVVAPALIRWWWRKMISSLLSLRMRLRMMSSLHKSIGFGFGFANALKWVRQCRVFLHLSVFVCFQLLGFDFWWGYHNLLPLEEIILVDHFHNFSTSCNLINDMGRK